MRKLVFKPNAVRSLYKVADWISEKNLPGSGRKFVEAVEVFLINYCSIITLKYPLCRSKRLALKKLSCVIFNRKWVITFKYTKTEFIVQEFIWGPTLR